ncbi:MAG TPA: site-specific integrase [Firmicutes bacterium]|nr:site-specific integrase [Bacillota bacterium]
MREGEILALQWQDVNLDAGTITVRRTLYRGGPNPIFSDQAKTEAGERTFKIHDGLVAALRQHRLDQKKAKMALGSEYRDFNLVFPTSKGTPMMARNLYRLHKSLIKAAGVPEVKFHELRHTHATHLIMAHVPLKTISARLGHSSITITQDIYGHVLQAMEDEATAAIQDLFGSSPDFRRKHSE